MVLTEMKKLEGNCQFRFVNNAAEEECKMEIEEPNKIMNEEEGEDREKLDIEEGIKGNEERKETSSKIIAKTECTVECEGLKNELVSNVY